MKPEGENDNAMEKADRGRRSDKSIVLGNVLGI